MIFPATQAIVARNIPGICSVDVIDVAQVLSVAPAVNGNVATTVTLVAGAAWRRVNLPPPGAEFQEKPDLVKGVLVAKGSLPMPLAKDQLALLAPLYSSATRRWLLVATTYNGDQLLLGTKEEPCQLVLRERTVGDEEARKNGYELAALVTRREPVPFYLGTPPEDIVPEDCPTFGQLLGDEDGADVYNAMTPEQRDQWLAAYGLATITEIDGGAPDTDFGDEVDGGGGDPPPPENEFSNAFDNAFA